MRRALGGTSSRAALLAVLSFGVFAVMVVLPGQLAAEEPAASHLAAEEPAATSDAAAPQEIVLTDEEIETARELVTTGAEPPCAVCHTLAAAEAAGTLGPSLDQLQPDAATVKAALLDGPGIMPDYADQLSEEQIELLANYVASVAGEEQP